MILVVEDRAPVTVPRIDPPPARCTLQQTLRRMGFYAARPTPPARPPGPARARPR